ncbi:MAG: RtcB family protein [bacterium]
MLEKIGKNKFRIPKSDGMRVEPILYLNGQLLKQLEKQAVKQFADAASLQGVVAVLGMPDAHTGFGIPIGGVLVMDANSGLISAGAVGMDINCGVRLLATPLFSEEVDDRDISRLAQMIAARVPTGVGKSSPHQKKLKPVLDDIFLNGVQALEKTEFVAKGDLEKLQDGGSFRGSDLNAITPAARERADQLSTLGGGNHFIEIDRVDEIFESKTARSYGLHPEQIVIQIHTGSRGFGHQTCVDYSNIMKENSGKLGIIFPTKGLAAAPIDSEIGRDYFAAMAAAANFAYTNRQILTYDIRAVFEKFAGNRFSKTKLEIVHDISHNLARFEEIDSRKLLIHRKGAVRALPAGEPDNPEYYSKIAPPVLVPGNMGSSSYVLRATENSKETYYSVNHGAGRSMSRTRAKKEISLNSLKKAMEKIPIFGAKAGQVIDEAPQAYKNIDLVVETLTEINITEKVARLSPLAVIKGD